MRGKFYAAVLVLAVCFAAGIAPMAARADTIDYPGSGFGALPMIIAFDKSLFPTSTSGNEVTVNGNEPTFDLYHVFGGVSDVFVPNIEENKVFIKGGTVDNWVVGGFNIAGSASNNEVTVSDGTVGFVTGGYSDSVGYAADNTVIISGGTIIDSVYGGESVDGDSTGNTVIISGGGITNPVSYIYGGSSGGGDATGNTVIISGGTMPGCTIHGGKAPSGVSSGNTLIIDKLRDSGVFQIDNFQIINFVLPAEPPIDAMLKVTNVANIADADIDITGVEAGAAFKAGDEIRLMTNTIIDSGYTNTVEADDGSKIYTFELSVDGMDLIATVVSVEDLPDPNPPKPTPKKKSSGLFGCDASGGLFGLMSLAALAFVRVKSGR